MTISLRTYDSTGDCAAVTSIVNQWNLVPVTVEAMQQSEHLVPAGSRRIVAVNADGKIVGFGPASPSGPGSYYAQVYVDRAHRRQGVGRLLYDDAVRFIVAGGGVHLQSQVRDDDPESLAFAERRGFKVDRHLFKSFLDLQSFDAARWESAVTRVTATGIRFATLAELGASEETLFKFYSLATQAVRDIPGHDQDDPRESFAEFCGDFHRAQLPLDSQLVALDGQEWAGFALLQAKALGGKRPLENDLTGVDRRYRGRGIAQALKVLAVQAAQRYGATHLWTRNDSENAPILAINRKMGYQPVAGTYSLVCKL